MNEYWEFSRTVAEETTKRGNMNRVEGESGARCPMQSVLANNEAAELILYTQINADTYGVKAQSHC